MTVREADLERTCTELLELDGWRSLKTDPVSRREWGKGFGEKGMADCLYIRYWAGKYPEYVAPRGDKSSVAILAEAQVMWIEWKTPKGRAAPHQHAWREYEQKLGALALIAGIDFPATFEGFAEFYARSALLRNLALTRWSAKRPQIGSHATKA